MILAPSILSADFGRLAAEVESVDRAGAGAIHVDVMDGRFVPSITVGPLVVRAARRATQLPLDVHLMIEEADRQIDAFVDAGASWISLHVEAVRHLERAVAHLRDRGVSPGVVLNPATPLCSIDEILPEVDYVLLMTVNPGFGGQRFLAPSLDKIRRLREILKTRRLTARIEVDGGIDEGNIRKVTAAGAEIVVVGSAVFGGQGSPEERARRLIEAAR